MSPSYIACEMISAVLFNLLWASSIMVSCFPCFIVRLLKNFHVRTVKKERATPNPPKEVPTGRPTLLANAGIETPSGIAADVIKSVSTMRVTLFNRFFFLACGLRASILSRKKCLDLRYFFNRYACASCGAVGFKSGQILVSLLYILIVYLIGEDRMSSG